MPNMSIKDSIALFLHKLGVTANLLTFLGLVCAGLSGYLIAVGNLFWAGIWLLVSGLLDMLDGAVARVSGSQSVFGGIIDSSLDRYGDGFIFGGLCYYFFNLERGDLVLFALSGWVAAFSISYVRARVECEVDSCRVGFWERGERIGFIVIALLVRNLSAAVIIVGVFLHWTVFQRLALAHSQTKKNKATPQTTPYFLRPLDRTNISYFLKLAALIATLLFWRPA